MTDNADLIKTAQEIVANGKGILAADESTGTIGKRFSSINLENNEENRRLYRELLFTSGKELSQYIGGVILFEETLKQKTSNGISFSQLLREMGIHVGIKVDKGLVDIPNTNEETITQGLDGLEQKCLEYHKLGATFAKWRAVFKINSPLNQEGKGCNEMEPTLLAIEENANCLARYAAICQQAGLVPIVEPEVLMDGSHSIETTAKVTQTILACVYKKLHDHKVLLEGTLLKPNMILPGQSCSKKSNPKEIAEYTLQVLCRTVPPAVPGITFLSGGQSEEEATENLLAINQSTIFNISKPWKLSFSYGRALQHGVLKSWMGKQENKSIAQKKLIERAMANCMASKGLQVKGDQSNASLESTFVKDYKY